MQPQKQYPFKYQSLSSLVDEPHNPSPKSPTSNHHNATTQPQTINSTHTVTLHTTPRNIFVALDDGTVRILDTEGKNERSLKGGERGGVCAVDTWFEEGREEEEWVAVGGTDCLVGVWWVGSL